jgi:hypothetical protein
MLRRHAFFFTSTALVAFVALVMGCSSSSGDDTATDVGPGDAAGDAIDTSTASDAPVETVNLDEHFPDTTDTFDNGGDVGCASVTNIALEVTENDVASDLPLGGGGLIADGTYTVTDVTKYTGVGGKTGPGTFKVTETIMITGGASIAGVRKLGDALGFQYAADIAPIAGGQLKWKQTCPSAPGATYGYDATSDHLIVYDATQNLATTYTFKFHTPGP